MNEAVLNASEQECMDHIVKAMQIISRDWGLLQGNNLSYELALHVHGLQGFVTQHMLQRIAPEHWGTWYEDEAIKVHDVPATPTVQPLLRKVKDG